MEVHSMYVCAPFRRLRALRYRRRLCVAHNRRAATTAVANTRSFTCRGRTVKAVSRERCEEEKKEKEIITLPVGCFAFLISYLPSERDHVDRIRRARSTSVYVIIRTCTDHALRVHYEYVRRSLSNVIASHSRKSYECQRTALRHRSSFIARVARNAISI